MKKQFILIGLLVFSGLLFCQQRKFSDHGSQVQLEALGTGGLVSFHFESRFLKSNTGIGYNIGVGVAPYGLFESSCNTGGVISFPAGINYLLGKKDHLLEMGLGAALKFGGGTKVYCPELDDNFFESDNSVYEYCLLGYRYQPRDKKLTLRIFISPLFQKDLAARFWGGASVGLRL